MFFMSKDHKDDQDSKKNKADKGSVVSTVAGIILSLISALLITVLTDFVCTFSFGVLLRIVILPVIFAGAFILMFIMFKHARHEALCLFIMLIVLPIAVVAAYRSFVKDSAYEDLPVSQESFFSGKTVMAIVPHEDDDINLMSGAVDAYIECGSTVYPVFVTNGDYHDLGEQRINEAIKGWAGIGVPEENIYFLGYGDQWNVDGPHIYNAPDDMQMYSAIGRTETYGTPTHPAYHNGNAYTRNNYKNDLKSLILEKRPDIIFASDYDPHKDHKAVSMIFEEVMGEILKENPDYTPIVYKGYAYCTAWRANDDFYAENVLSVKEPGVSEFEPNIYAWDERVRFPVGTSSLSRSVFGSDIYEWLSCHDTQNANSHVLNLINSDKVYWQRRTDSLLKNATITAGYADEAADTDVDTDKNDTDATDKSGDEGEDIDIEVNESSRNPIGFLTDFRLLHNDDLMDEEHLPFDGVFYMNAEAENGAGSSSVEAASSISVKLDSVHDISYITLYDNPSADDNITDARIVFDDGTEIDTGELNPDGTATYIEVDKTGVSSFELEVTKSTGEYAGLMEIEAYETDRQTTDHFIKITDEDNNFIYDYIMPSDECIFNIYSNDPDLPPVNEDDYEVTCTDDSCKVTISNGMIIAKCPRGVECDMTVRLKGSDGLTDTVHLDNAHVIRRTIIAAGQYIEKQYVYPISEGAYYNLAMHRVYEKLKVFL